MSNRRKNLNKIFPGTGQWDAKLKAWALKFKISVWQSGDDGWVVSQALGGTHYSPRETDPIKTLQLLARTAQTRKGDDWASRTYGRNCMMELCLIFNLRIYDGRYKPDDSHNDSELHEQSRRMQNG